VARGRYCSFAARLVRTVGEGVYCQIVRYGTDQYIEKMASDQERYEGRLQNRVYKLRTHRHGGGR
jgi:hypothetical protein